MRGRPAPRRDRAGAALGLAGTAAFHAAAAGMMLLFAARSDAVEPSPPTYAVELVAAPASTPAQRRLSPEAIPTAPPEEAPAPVAPKPPAPDEPAAPAPKPPEPKPRPRPTQPAQPDREKAPPTRSETTPLPGESGTGTDVATVRTPGLAFPFPEYLRNIANQVLGRFGVQDSRLTAEVSFMIMRDGTVREVRFLKRSGSFSFDLEAQGAIEAAANAGAFGPLPSGWTNDVLPVTFVFEPR